MPELFIGLMSGTSLDGIDAVLGAGVPRVAGSYDQPFDPALRQELLALNQPEADELERAAFTTSGIRDAIGNYGAGATEVYVCGGGARNSTLMKLLSEQLAGKKVAAIDTLGVSAEHVEALAWRALNRQPGNLPSVTGAHGARVLPRLKQKRAL
jgi:1,6-anhydro-N-acetylmuramate kinase